MSSPETYKEIKKQLENKFLYENDLDSIYYLFYLIENEQRVNGLRPKYISREKIARGIRNSFAYRDDADLIASTVIRLINNDINRLELSMYVEAYTIGSDCKPVVDRLEAEVLSFTSAKSLFGRKRLLHDSKSMKVRHLKKSLLKEVFDPIDYFYYNRKLILKYCQHSFKNSILSLNKYLNKQMVLKYDDSGYFITEEQFLTQQELNNLYERIVQTFIRSLNSLCKEACWYGLNDRVLSRYR